MDNLQVVNETTLIVEKKPLASRTKLKKSLKDILNFECEKCLKIRPD